MLRIEEDLTVEVTRGDAITLDISATDGETNYTFQPGEVLRLKVFEKKNVENVMLQKDTTVSAATETVSIALSASDTKLGEPINKPTEFWYEVELNPDKRPQTLIGYDERGSKILRLYPEGGDKA